jgi:hypothetical protein
LVPRQTPTRLLRDTVIGVLESQWDFDSGAMEARITRPLLWFGLMESRTEGKSPTEIFDRRLYRKAPLFDCFAKFNIQVEGYTRHLGKSSPFRKMADSTNA